jgi:hypothetical protein
MAMTQSIVELAALPPKLLSGELRVLTVSGKMSPAN